MSARRALRAFSLLELTLGAVMVLTIATVAMGVMVSVQSVQRDAQAKAVVTRDAQFTLDMLARDLQYVGVGVPRGEALYEGPPATATNPNRRLRPAIRIGHQDYLAFIGDLPYPNADVNGSMVLQNSGNPSDPACPTPACQSPAAMHSWHVASELAMCAPPATPPGTAAYRCRTGQNRLIDVGSTADCGSGNAATAATCPWSLGKWQGTDGSDQFPAHVVISNPLGAWVRRELVGFDVGVLGEAVSVRATPGYPSSASTNPNPRNVKADLAPLDFVMRRSGASLVAQLDRVFYSLEKNNGSPCAGTSDCVLRRRQCWAWPDGMATTAGDFPGVAAAPIDSGSSISGCSPPDQGTDWEAIMHGISSMRFRYFARSNPDVELAAPLDANEAADVMFIQIDVELSRTMPGPTPGAPPTVIKQLFTRRVFMEDSGGSFIDLGGARLPPGVPPPGAPGVNDVTPAGGGCETELSCGRH